MCEAHDTIRGVTSADANKVEVACAEKPAPAADGRKKAYAATICAFVASTGFFHGYDNGVVNDVFTMPSFRSMMGWPEEDSLPIQKRV